MQRVGNSSTAETQIVTEICFTFRDIPWCMLSRLAAHRRRYHNFSRLSIFAVSDTDFIQEKKSSAVQRGTYSLKFCPVCSRNDFVRGTKKDQICPGANDWKSKLTRAVILNLFSRNWRAEFRVLCDSVKNLSLRILVKSIWLPSMSGWIHSMLERPFHTTFWAFESTSSSVQLIYSWIFYCDSPKSQTEAICWHPNSIVWKIASFRRISQRFLRI
jgi:hypothetical protein